MTPSAPEQQERPLRILFFLYHSGYLRHYREAIRVLAGRGHAVHLAHTVVEKDAGDRRLVEELAAEFPGRITFGEAPTRRYLDGWRRTSILVRAFTDLARYIDPRYANAPALRKRMAQKIKLNVLSGRADPVTTKLLVRAIDRLRTQTDPALGARLLRFLRAAEAATPTSRVIDRFVAGFRPDAVLVTPLVEYASSQVDYVKSAAGLGVPTAACIASWDNLTNKGLLRVTPDRVIVWNEIQRRELAELHGVGGERAIVTGGAKFDPWFELAPSRSAEEHKRVVGLDPQHPYLLYVCSSYFIAPDEVSFVRRLLTALRSAPDDSVRELGLLVRPHPQNAAQWDAVDLGDANVAIWPALGAQPDSGEQRTGFYDSIAHSAAVVGVNTSAMIDAAIVGKNVFTVLDAAFADTQEGTLHFHYLLRENGGFLNVAHNFEEHCEQLARALAGGEEESARVREFIESFVRPRGLDRPVAPILADELEGVAKLPRRLPEPLPLRLRLLRAALWAPTVAATAALLAGRIAEQVTLGHSAEQRRLRLERTRAAASERG
jgi:hypothetical protein